MKRASKILFIGYFAALGATGCSKFLEKEPDNRAKLDSPEKVSQLLGTAYPQASYQLMAELSSDNSADLITNGLDVPDLAQLNRDIYLYQDNKGSGSNEDTPEGYWFGCYKAIATANLALNKITSVSNQQDYSAQKGEALVARAYAHFMLVNFFSRFYNSATAASDPGVPYVTEPETVSVKQYDRGTVQGVYEKIEKDLLEGLPLLDDSKYSVPKYHFNKSAANAFAARFYLFKKDYNKVITFATASLPQNTIAGFLRPWNTVYNKLPLNGSGSIPQIYGAATEKANLLLAESPSYWKRSLGLGRYGASPSLIRSVTGADPITGRSWSFSSAFLIDAHSFVPKIDEYFVETSIGSNIGTGWQMIPLFTSEEVLFNLAEAYTYTGATSQAITLLNNYLSTRLESYSASADVITASDVTGATGQSLQDGLITLILFYKRLEFIHEGLRWFDILRYNIEVTHTQLNSNGNVVNTIKLAKDSPHRMFQVPPTTAESGIAPNPR